MASGYCERCGDASGLPHVCHPLPPLLQADLDAARRQMGLPDGVPPPHLTPPDVADLQRSVVAIIEQLYDLNNRLTALELARGIGVRDAE